MGQLPGSSWAMGLRDHYEEDTLKFVELFHMFHVSIFRWAGVMSKIYLIVDSFYQDLSDIHGNMSASGIFFNLEQVLNANLLLIVPLDV